MLASVPSVYVRRQAQHLVTLPRIGVMVVLGNNGWVWVCAPPKVAGSGRQETINFSQMDVRYHKVNPDMRLGMSVLLCCLHSTTHVLHKLDKEREDIQGPKCGALLGRPRPGSNA